MSHRIVVKGYQLCEQVDETGIRVIYRAIHLSSKREVFLTVFMLRAGRSQKMLARRAEQSKQLVWKRLASVLDHGTLPGGQFFFTQEARPSFPIAQVLREGKLGPERFFWMARYMMDALEAVAYIHGAGTTHRDLATHQLRVDADDGILLEGFINARPKTESKSVVNLVNLPYMSPELLLGANADAATDIYSMGIVLFELLTAQLPYKSNYAKIEDMRRGNVPAPSMYALDVPVELETITMRALSPRGTRYRDVSEFLEDLESFYNRRSMRFKIRDFSQSVKSMFTVSS